MPTNISYTKLADRNVSFGLIRTNPKLTSNVKLTVDSAGDLWLNSIDAVNELTNRKYKKYRNKSLPREILLPAQKKWAQDRNSGAIGLTFNDYNKNLIYAWKRKRLGELRTPRQSHHLFYNNFNEVDFPVTIQYTKQWIIYEKLDPTFNFDWSTIK